MRLEERKHFADRVKTRKRKAQHERINLRKRDLALRIWRARYLLWIDGIPSTRKEKLSDDFMGKVWQQLNWLILHAFHYTSCCWNLHEFLTFCIHRHGKVFFFPATHHRSLCSYFEKLHYSFVKRCFCSLRMIHSVHVRVQNAFVQRHNSTQHIFKDQFSSSTQNETRSIFIPKNFQSRNILWSWENFFIKLWIGFNFNVLRILQSYKKQTILNE